jgi:hypothetical protein
MYNYNHCLGDKWLSVIRLFLLTAVFSTSWLAVFLILGGRVWMYEESMKNLTLVFSEIFLLAFFPACGGWDFYMIFRRIR